MRTRVGALASIRAWASVLMATNSTPWMPSSIIRLTALQPPPPTPTTLMRANVSACVFFVSMIILLNDDEQMFDVIWIMPLLMNVRTMEATV